MKLSLRLAPLVLVFPLAACGGASSDLFGGAGEEPQDDIGTSAGDGGVVGTADAGATPVDASLDGEATADAFVLDAAPPDASPKNRGIRCGKQSGGDRFCSFHAQACCASAQGPTVQYACVSSPSAECDAGVRILCDDQADCPGKVCCGTLDADRRYASVECRATCDADQERQLCDPAANPTGCPAGWTCAASTLLGGLSVCSH